MASAAARALDAADGVIDGRYYGRPIVQAPSYSRVGGVAPSYIRGAPVYGTTIGGYAGASSTAAALDAADGVIDGKYYGRPIVQGGAVPAYATRTFAPTTYAGAAYAAPAYGAYAAPAYGAAYGGSSALALDAADGVIDGKFYGRQIVGGGAAPVISRSFAPTTYAGNSALALDAADGVIDGKFYGRQIVGGGVGAGALVTHPRAYAYGLDDLDARYGYGSGYGYGAGYGRPLYGSYGYGGYSTSYTPSYAAAIPATTYANRYRATAAPYYGGSYGYGYAGRFAPAYQPAGYSTGNASAAALDAADGVIDGRFYGRPIVGA